MTTPLHECSITQRFRTDEVHAVWRELEDEEERTKLKQQQQQEQKMDTA